MYNHGHSSALDASDWIESQYTVDECNAFSEFLYKTGVAEHKAALGSVEYKKSLMDAMMVSVASELWNGREYNFMAQYIEEKLLSANPLLASNANDWRNAKGYVMGHSGEVENKHDLHALAAAQAFSRLSGMPFEATRLKEVMLDYNERVGRAFYSLCEALKS
jgi:hypothetical protein